MLKVGGYAMSFKDATDWARRHYPGIDIYDERLIPNVIQRHNNLKLGGKIRCIATHRDQKTVCLFVTHWKNDPDETFGRFDPFIEDEETIRFKRRAFTNSEDWEKAQFVTIMDPYEQGY